MDLLETLQIGIGLAVAPFQNLAGGGLGVFVSFEFHHIQVLRHHKHRVDTSCGYALLPLYSRSERHHEAEEHRVVISFILDMQFVGYLGEKGFDAIDE